MKSDSAATGSSPLPGLGIHAFAAGNIRVVTGANLGDSIGGPDDCALGDIYRLKPEARPKRLIVAGGQKGDRSQTIAAGSAVGKEGDRIWPMAILTLMAPDGERLTIVTIWHEESEAVFALPLSPIRPGINYALVDIDPDAARAQLADVICVSFTAGTLITLPGGAQTRIEALRPGHVVLTRDNGPQPVRWIGKATLRATGAFAPIVISAGTLDNLGNLVVSPHHRLFLYQRGKRRLTGQPEALVQAKHLVDDDRVWRREGGFVDYYSLVFDRHEIIFAEGIAVESLMVSEATVRLLPPEIADDLRQAFPGLRHSPHFAAEADRARIEAEGHDRLFRKKP